MNLVQKHTKQSIQYLSKKHTKLGQKDINRKKKTHKPQIHKYSTQNTQNQVRKNTKSPHQTAHKYKEKLKKHEPGQNQKHLNIQQQYENTQ